MTHVPMCCYGDTIVAFYAGQFWMRKTTWLSGQWAPQGLPGGATIRRSESSETDRPKPARRRRPR